MIHPSMAVGTSKPARGPTGQPQRAALHAGWPLWLGAWLVASGCSLVPHHHAVLGPAYVPANVYRNAPKLPPTLRRVVLLPLAVTVERVPDEATIRETLEPVLQEELLKSKRFEVVSVPLERLQQRLGRTRWTAEEKLPAEFFSSLQEICPCEAVLFAQVTVFRAYPPLAVGWRLKLVGANGAPVLWATDEVFDVGEPAVVNGARRYQEAQQQPGAPLNDSRAILSSPRRFAHYSAAALLATLPER
jgi:hypothetical protein